MIHPFKTISIIGGGTMGQGIALASMLAGYRVLLIDSNEAIITLAQSKLEATLQSYVDKKKITEDQKQAICRRTQFHSSIDCIEGELVIEAIMESLPMKQKLLQDIEQICTHQTIFASNTSSLSISTMAHALQHPERMAGLHFFNPAHLMRLVEVIAGEKSNEVVVQQLVQFSTSLNKISVVVKDSPGFIVNRVALHFYLESLNMLENNTAYITTIDRLLRNAGFKMGPFELMDLIGLDINLAVSTSLYQAIPSPRFKPNAIQQKLVALGNLGIKTGKGFYEYPAKK